MDASVLDQLEEGRVGQSCNNNRSVDIQELENMHVEDFSNNANVCETATTQPPQNEDCPVLINITDECTKKDDSSSLETHKQMETGIEDHQDVEKMNGFDSTNPETCSENNLQPEPMDSQTSLNKNQYFQYLQDVNGSQNHVQTAFCNTTSEESLNEDQLAALQTITLNAPLQSALDTAISEHQAENCQQQEQQQIVQHIEPEEQGEEAASEDNFTNATTLQSEGPQTAAVTYTTSANGSKCVQIQVTDHLGQQEKWDVPSGVIDQLMTSASSSATGVCPAASMASPPMPPPVMSYQRYIPNRSAPATQNDTPHLPRVSGWSGYGMNSGYMPHLGNSNQHRIVYVGQSTPSPAGSSNQKIAPWPSNNQQYSTPYMNVGRNPRRPDFMASTSVSDLSLNSSGEETRESPEYSEVPRVPNNTPMVETYTCTNRSSSLSELDGSLSPVLKAEDPGRLHHNAKERFRRARIKDACEQMRLAVPGLTDKTDKATVFEFSAQYIQYLRGIVGSQHDRDFLHKFSPY